MRLVAQLRALFTLIMLASYSPLGVAVHRVVEQTEPSSVHQVDSARPRPEFRYLGNLRIFTGRLHASLPLRSNSIPPRLTSRAVRRGTYEE